MNDISCLILWTSGVQFLDEEHIEVVRFSFELDSFHPHKFLAVLVQVYYLLYGLDF